MKQIAFVILIMLLAVPVFASGEKEAASKAGPAEITFWHIWDGTRTPLIEQEIADFNKIHPEIKVSHTLIAAQGMQEKYLTAIAGGDPPNVIMIRGADIPAFASRKALVLLDGYAKKDGLKLDEIFFEGEIKSHYYKGSAYSLPVVTGGGNFMLLWNKSIFKEAGLDPEKGPATWDDMYEISKRLAQLEGGKLKRMALNPLAGGSIPARNTPYQVWSFGNNASYMSEDGKQITLDSKEGVETLEYILKLIDLYGGIENVASISGPDRNTNRLAFYNGQSVMVNEGSYIFFMMSKEAPNLSYGAAEMPYNSKNPKAASHTPLEGGWGYAITAGSKTPEASWEFVNYVTAGKGNRKFCLAQKRPSPVKEYSNDPELSGGNSYWPVVLNALDHGVPVTVVPVSPKIKDVIQTMEENVWYHKLTPQEAASRGKQEAQKILDEYWSKQ